MSEPIIVEYEKENDKKRNARLEAYSRFFEELKKKEITPYRVHKDTGIATATLSDWKNGISMPKSDKMDTISDYLGVSTDYINYGTEKNISDEDALLDARISEDAELKQAIKKYYSLNDRQKKHVIELIELLSQTNDIK